MNRPERELAERIVAHLDHGTEHLDARTRARLAAARQTALARYREQPAAAGGLARAGIALARVADWRSTEARALLVAVALAAATAGIAYWQSNGTAAGDLAEIDSALLTGELPINAYLDKGFDKWLKRSSR